MSKMNIADLSDDIINKIKEDVIYHNTIKALIYEYSKECVMREVEYLEYWDEFEGEYITNYLKRFKTYSYEKWDDLFEAFNYADEGLKYLKENNCFNKKEINEMIYDRLYKSGVDLVDIRYFRYKRDILFL